VFFERVESFGKVETSVLAPTEESLDLVASWIRQGGVAALPTETVYGLAADALHAEAVRSIFEIKGRPSTRPLIVHVEDVEQLLEWAEVDGRQRSLVHTLAEKFSPGPLSYVLPKNARVPDIVTAGRPTVALRIPNHPVFRAVLRRSGCAIAAPSANPSGDLSPTSAAHVLQSLGGKLRYILDGGDCPVGLESTLLDLSRSPLCLLRPGKISLEEIQAVLPAERVENCAQESDHAAEKIPVPGTSCRHYRPGTPLYLFSQEKDLALATEKNRARVFLSPKEVRQRREGDFFLSGDGDLAVVARRLFAVLREVDRSCSYEEIYCQCPAAEGPGAAIADRLRRAATSSG